MRAAAWRAIAVAVTAACASPPPAAQPSAPSAPPAVPAPAPLASQTADETGAFALARKDGKGVMVFFTARWCAACLAFQRDFDADSLRDLLPDVVPVRFDVTEASDANAALQARYGVRWLPAVIFFAADGAEVGRVQDYLAPDAFRAAFAPMRAALRPSSPAR